MDGSQFSGHNRKRHASEPALCRTPKRQRVVLTLGQKKEQKDDRFLGPVQGLLDLVDRCLVEKQSQKTQTTIDTFFAA